MLLHVLIVKLGTSFLHFWPFWTWKCITSRKGGGSSCNGSHKPEVYQLCRWCVSLLVNPRHLLQALWGLEKSVTCARHPSFARQKKPAVDVNLQAQNHCSNLFPTTLDLVFIPTQISSELKSKAYLSTRIALGELLKNAEHQHWH